MARDNAVTAPPRIKPKSTRQYGKTRGYADGGPVGDPIFPQFKPLKQLPQLEKIPQFSWDPLPGGGIRYR